MARSTKRGIAYFSMDVDIFSDRKIRRVMYAHGMGAVTVVVRALCAVYGEKGYYAEADDDFYFDLAHELGTDEAFVRAVIGSCVASGFFDSRLFGERGVLTSRRIQRNYADATKRRDNAQIDPALRLIEDDAKDTADERQDGAAACISGDNASTNPDTVCNNPDTVCNNGENAYSGSQSKVNKTKEEQKRGEESISSTGAGGKATAACADADMKSLSDIFRGAFAPDTHTTTHTRSHSFIKPSVDDVKAYCTERKNGVDAHRFVDFYESKGWMVGLSPMVDWQACVRKWESDTYSHLGTFERPAENYDHLAMDLFAE